METRIEVAADDDSRQSLLSVVNGFAAMGELDSAEEKKSLELSSLRDTMRISGRFDIVGIRFFFDEA